MRRLPLLAPLLCLLVAGCAGGGGGGGKSIGTSIGGVTLTGSNGHALSSGPLPAGHALTGTITGLHPYDQALVALNGPSGSHQTPPYGLPSCTTYFTLKSDKTGSIPLVDLSPRLSAGQYGISVYDLTSRTTTSATPILKLKTAFTVASSPTTTPSVTTGYATSGGFTTNATFVVGDNIAATGAGLPKNSTVYVYVVAHKAVWNAGDALVDVAGTKPYTPPSLPPGTRSVTPKLLSGSAPAVQTSSTGAFGPVVIWSGVSAQAANQFFDVIVDVHGTGFYDPVADLLADSGEGSFTVTTSASRTTAGPATAHLAYNSSEVPQTLFNIPDTCYTQYGTIPSGNGTYTTGTLYVCLHKSTWSAGDPLIDVSGPAGASNPAIVQLVNGSPIIPVSPLYPADMLPGQEYDVIIDTKKTGKFDPTSDVLDGGASPSFTVDVPTTPKKWTVMVYMDGDNNLASDAITNIEQMEQVVYGTTPSVNVVVQWAQSGIAANATGYPAGCRRYIMAHGSNPNVINTQPVQSLGTVDMASPAQLTEFIDWGKAIAPANNYALILWDHGSGVHAAAKKKQSAHAAPSVRPSNAQVAKPSALLWDSDANDSMEVPACHDAIQAAGGVNLLATDMCLMGSVELAYQMKDVCTTYVGSAYLEPGTGYPYNTILGSLVSLPGETDQALGKTIVSSYGAYYTTNPNKYTCVAVDETQIGAAVTAISSVSSALTGGTLLTQASVQDGLYGLWASAQNYDDLSGAYTDYKDAQDLFLLMGGLNLDPGVTSAATAAVTALQSCTLAEAHSANFTYAHGLTLDYPNGGQWPSASPTYSQLSFAANSTWPTFLTNLWTVQFNDPLGLYVAGEIGSISVSPAQETGRTYQWSITSGTAFVSDGASTGSSITTSNSTCTVSAPLSASGVQKMTVSATQTYGSYTFTIATGELDLQQLITHPVPAVVYNYVDPSDSTKGSYAVALPVAKVSGDPYLRILYYAGLYPQTGRKYLLSAPSSAVDPDNTSGPVALGLTPIAASKTINLNGGTAHPVIYLYDMGDRALMLFQTFTYDSTNQDAASANATAAAATISVDSSWFATLTAN